MPSMLAVEAHERGGVEKLHVERVDRPEPSRGEALVEVHAAAITPTEMTWDTTWTTADGRTRLPTIPSHEVSGVVVAAGEGRREPRRRRRLRLGRLLSRRRGGGVRRGPDRRPGEETEVGRSPSCGRPSVVHAHGMARSVQTWRAPRASTTAGAGRSRRRRKLRGAARASPGAEVIAVASALDQQLVKELGAHEVIDYKTQRFEDAVSEVDVVFDTVGGDVQRRAWTVLKRGGRLVSIVEQPSAKDADEHHAHGVMFIVEPNRDDLTSIADLVDNGELTPVVSAVFPLVEGPTAYVTGLRDHVPGKIVLEVRR